MEGVWYLLGAVFAVIISGAFVLNYWLTRSKIDQHPMLATIKVRMVHD